MKTFLSSHEASAYEALDRLLFTEWDPLRMSVYGGPDDEYRSYLPELWRLVSSGQEETRIAEYLARIERDMIEVETSEERRLDVARKASALFAGCRISVGS